MSIIKENSIPKKNEVSGIKKRFDNIIDVNITKIFDKKIEEDNLTQKFPQFSLNINNPISWKLMLLIMLMQLLTNIMLVVVLYLK